ncbi:primosomal protein DnaI [Caldalkalibacillus mannanilyticus]|uniref:primosomal protein DnaI n=1 Tax=Caldalkalibacillus mannanilyticus TaxID=1418 RepID=UPI00046AB331|nr:primosomal protein DnaI [Caldalkalibacillus mannanilyticus]
MKALRSSLEQFLESRQIHKKIESKEAELLNHPLLLRWWQDHPEWSKEEVARFLIKVRQYVSDLEQCEACRGLEQCQTMLQGHYPQMFAYGKMLDLEYTPCTYLKKAEAAETRAKLINSHHIPKDILEGSFRDFDLSAPEREDAFEAVLQFCLQANPGQNAIGLYLYGPLGVGKSYLLGAACNKLAERGIASYMVYTPDFFLEIKNAIAEQRVEEKMNALKNIPVLIFDDIGAESISAWARDEVLGPILQYRVMKKLPTLYTSNYSYEQLEEHLSYSQKGGIEEMKAMRIMERIRHYTDSYLVKGINRRKRS